MAPLSSRLDALAKQLLHRSWSFGASLDLPWDLTLNGAFGRQQAVLPDLTSSSVDASLELAITPWLTISGGWTRYFGDGDPLDVGTGGLEVEF